MPSSSEVGRRPEAAISHPPTDAPQTAVPGHTAKAGDGGGRCPWWIRCCPCCRRGSKAYQVAEKTVEDREDGDGDPETDRLLRVTQVDLLSDREDVNRQRHHTSEYESEGLIVRRGDRFNMKVVFNRAPDPLTDRVVILLRTGENPQPAKGTEVTLTTVDQLEKGKWGAAVLGREAGGKELSISIWTPPNCPIGKYQLTANPQGPSSASPAQTPQASLYILFNPWCPDDVVYLEDERMREEYVLNETGRIYYGTEHQIGARTWNFGQFSKGVLEACLYILDKSKMPTTGRSDPISVVRKISAMINSQDEGGVLEGNWSGDYRGGTAPTAWVGSVAILVQYHQDQRPVRYGQCWVFSAVVTTVLRCLGIATRSVTNFASAHDTDVSLTNDIYLDEDMKPLDHLNYDSIWNFHVWNDCWMARPDLPVGLGGWQAIDATPQETSCGLYCCGPASVEAIRNGMVYLKYDSPFIFAEVNSDKVYWQRQADGSFQKVHVEKKVVGHKLSTKAVGSDEREDITDSYKYPEGTDEERIAVVTACRHGSRPETYGDECACDVDVTVSTEDGVIMGQDFTVTVSLTNTSSECRSLTLLVQAVVMYYTGVVKGTFKRDKHEVLLEPHKEKVLALLFHRDDYLEFLVDQAAMMFTTTGRVRETGQAIVKQHNFRLRTPDLRITPVGDARIGKVLKVEISVTNPLPKALNNVTLRIEGPGLQHPRKIPIGDVPRHANVTVTENLMPVKVGARKLIASLDCPQLTQVHGVAEIMVQDN